MASGTLIAPPEAPATSRIADRRREYRCECGHVLRVFGGGRHRVYFEPANAQLDDPVMNGTCPGCRGGFAGQEPIVTVHRAEQTRAPRYRRDRP